MKAGRSRALRKFPARPCERCGTAKAERHHKDENTLNNDPSNVEFLCKPCHLAEHNTSDRLREMARTRNRRGSANSHATLTEWDVAQIKVLRDGGATMASLGLRFGVSATQICRIIHKKAWAQ